ncbi:LOW QUALITY PROTEIN: hypothetical protein CRUP_022732 [Coryphaenoides rupestris]|nr:LOW QUALITY PROTEIN: hypothetical protein CRUP_022732 [Coryphaenoides rupestris]
MASTSPTHSDSSGSSKHDGERLRAQDSWEIVEGLRGGPANMQEPPGQEGYLLKRRKWPMKGWHKVKSPELFEEWVTKLRNHRVFRQNEIAMYPHERHLFLPHGTSSPSLNDSMRKASTYDIPKKEKRPRRWRSKNSGKDAKASLQVPSCISSKSPRLHASNPNLSTAEPSSVQDPCPESPDSPTDANRLQEDFCRLANNIHTTLKSAYSSLSAERERLRHTVGLNAPPSQQDCPDTSRPLVHQVSNDSKASITESMSEFFDAHEYFLSSSSSENEVSDDDSYISDPQLRRVWNILRNNIGKDLSKVAMPVQLNEPINTLQRLCEELEYSELLDTASRTADPHQRMVSNDSKASITESMSEFFDAHDPSCGGVSVWNILRNNIGKDLSKVAMPVQLNEPINTLQRLCEELEYSELLDTASRTADPHQRMPFNPVLGETYECSRTDKGFRFIAEQVSHHPPVSACHCDSKNFTFSQDMRWKNKFWGKSMEIVPMGTTHRWIEHYGEMTIRNLSSDACHCKVTFIKAKSWSSTVNEIEGVVTDGEGRVIHSLFGKWHEGVYQGDPPLSTCIWRPNPMPLDHEQYYGFTQFAVELNELGPELRALLPPMDTRFRPDQRKSQDDTWVTTNTYWDQRREPGFAKMDFPVLW